MASVSDVANRVPTMVAMMLATATPLILLRRSLRCGAREPPVSPSRRRAALALGAAALALAACKTVGPDFKAPTASGAQGYAMSGDAVSPRAMLTPEARAAGPWWTAFASPTLDKVMTEALAGNRTAAEAEANLQKAQAQAASVRGSLGPQADLSASARRSRINTQAFGFTGFPSRTLSLYSVGAAVAYDLDLFGGGRRRLEAANAHAEAEGARADAAYLTLTGNVALQAVRIAGLRGEIAALEAVIADDHRNVEIARKAEAAGGEAPSAGTGARAQLAEDEALLPPLQRDLAELAAPAAIPVSLPSDLVRKRPDIRAAEADLHAATAQIGVAEAARYPSLKLTADLTQTALTPGDLFSTSASGWNIGAGLAQPLFRGGSLKANQRAAEAEARASLARYEQTVLTAFVQVSDVLAALAHDDAEIRALTEARAAAEASLADAQTAWRLGGGPFKDIVDEQRDLNEARRNLAAAQSRRLADVVALYAATAADWRAP
jgi:outer membrane protein TolC